jgi:hypothetical protein
LGGTEIDASAPLKANSTLNVTGALTAAGGLNATNGLSADSITARNTFVLPVTTSPPTTPCGTGTLGSAILVDSSTTTPPPALYVCTSGGWEKASLTP